MTPTFENRMTKIAQHIADKAVNKDTPFAESLDAFKSLTAYYALLLKNKTAPEDDPDAANFDNFGKRFGATAEENEHGGTEARVRGHRRNGSPDTDA